MVTPMMRATAEVRWFYPGELPEAVAAWFERLGPLPPSASRTDWYLRPTDPGLNIKLREGRMEIKRRDGSGEPVTPAPHVAGCLERWSKWSFPLSEGATEGEPFGQDTRWIAVCKTRRLRPYHLDEAGGIAPVSEEDEPESGCEVEVSQLEVGGSVFWSVCLEAYGKEQVLRDLLLGTAAHVFEPDGSPTLDSAHALGYAAWLMQR